MKNLSVEDINKVAGGAAAATLELQTGTMGVVPVDLSTTGGLDVLNAALAFVVDPNTAPTFLGAVQQDGIDMTSISSMTLQITYV